MISLNQSIKRVHLILWFKNKQTKKNSDIFECIVVLMVSQSVSFVNWMRYLSTLNEIFPRRGFILQAWFYDIASHLKLCHSASLQTIWKYMFYFYHRNQYFVETFYSKDIFVVLLTYWCALKFYLMILASSFIFNCECHSFRCKPQISQPKSLYFVNFSIL